MKISGTLKSLTRQRVSCSASVADWRPTLLCFCCRWFYSHSHTTTTTTDSLAHCCCRLPYFSNPKTSLSLRLRLVFCIEMEGVIGLVNRIQRAWNVLSEYGDDRSLPTLWDALPTIVVLGGQVLVFFFF